MKSPFVQCRLDTVSVPNLPKSLRVTLTDEARGIRIGVIPAAGGEIGSFQLKDGARWREILYRAMRYDAPGADGWAGRAPTLWPAVGRSFTERQLAAWRRTGKPPAHCAYIVNGRERRIDCHGFARSLPWSFANYGYGREEAWVTCALRSSAATRRVYPFEFETRATYALDHGSLVMRYEVAAGRGNRGPMPFCLGNHISLKLPFFGRGRFSDCTLRSSAARILEQSPLCLLSGRTTPAGLSRAVSVGKEKYQDTVLGGMRHDAARLELNDPKALKLVVTQGEVPAGRRRLADRNIFFVLWASPKLGYFCPEPWAGRPDGLNDPAGRVSLPPGERFVWEAKFQPVRNARRG